jgi:hypothetical protein
MQTLPLKVRRRETQHSPKTPRLVVSGLRTPCPACPDRFLIFCPQITLLCDATTGGGAPPMNSARRRPGGADGSGRAGYERPACQVQRLRRRHSVRDHGCRAAVTRAQAGRLTRPQSAHHKHRWIAKSRSADHQRRQSRRRHLASRFLCTLGEATPDPAAAKTFVAEWNSRGLPFGGLTSSFRGYDGIRAITEAIKIAGKAEPEAIRAALWKVDILGLNGPIKFEKDGLQGQESGQSTPNVYLVKIDNGNATVPKI